jgi:hypothetical protein
MLRSTLLLAALAAALVPTTAHAFSFRTLTLDVTLTHTADWQTDGAAGRQALTFATPHPVRQTIVVYGERGAPPFQTMTNDELTFDPPRAEVRRTVTGAAPCATTHPRVRTRFAVEEDEFQFTVGGVPRLATPCPPAQAELTLAEPAPVVFEGGARKVKRLRRGGRVTLRAHVERGPDGEACAPRPAAGPWECATTTATVKVRRVE